MCFLVFFSQLLHISSPSKHSLRFYEYLKTKISQIATAVLEFLRDQLTAINFYLYRLLNKSLHTQNLSLQVPSAESIILTGRVDAISWQTPGFNYGLIIELITAAGILLISLNKNPRPLQFTVPCNSQ